MEIHGASPFVINFRRNIIMEKNYVRYILRYDYAPERKMMYVEKPGFMYTDEELSAMNEEIYLSMVEYNLQYND